MSDANTKKKSSDRLTPVKTCIRNGGDNDDLSFMGSPPLLPFDDPDEYEKLRDAVRKSAPADFFGQFFARMFTDTAWDFRRYQAVTTNSIKAELEHFPDRSADPGTKLAAVVNEKLDLLERMYHIINSRERRLDRLYGLVQEHRANMGTASPPIAEHVQDTEFREVGDGTGDAIQVSEKAHHDDQS